MVTRTKIKKPTQPSASGVASRSAFEGANPFASAYAARLEKQVAQALSSPRQSPKPKGKKARAR